MKKAIYVVLSIVLAAPMSYAQTQAITEYGETVVLYDDGTWGLANDNSTSIEDIPLNETEFKKDKTQDFQVKSTRADVGIWINKDEWSFTKGELNEDSEYGFQLKGQDLYAMLIAEQIEIPLESLVKVAVSNARSVAPDISLEKEEFRMVNGIKVLALKMSGTIEGIRFTYFGYYYSSAGGTVQLISYTGESLFTRYEKDIEKFLNGMVKR